MIRWRVVHVHCATKVEAVVAYLQSLEVEVSSVRVAGLFTCNFTDLEGQLLLVQQQLAEAGDHPCLHGVAEAIGVARALQQQLLSTAQVGARYKDFMHSALLAVNYGQRACP